MSTVAVGPTFHGKGEPRVKATNATWVKFHMISRVPSVELDGAAKHQLLLMRTRGIRCPWPWGLDSSSDLASSLFSFCGPAIQALLCRCRTRPGRERDESRLVCLPSL